MNGVVGDISVVAALHGAPEPVSTLCYLKPRELCNFFSPLARHAETLFATGRAPYPILRTLLTTGLTAAGVASLSGRGRVETPHLATLAYAVPAGSTFMGAPSTGGNPLPLPPGEAGAGVNGRTPTLGRRKRIAVIGTAWGYSTHTDHISNRFLSGYPINGGWHHPEMDVVSAYIRWWPLIPATRCAYVILESVCESGMRVAMDIDQGVEFPAGGGEAVDTVGPGAGIVNLAARRAATFGFTLFPSIAEALRCGGDVLARDAVLMNAEYGDYASNRLGHKLYPRRLWFREIVKVFEADCRAVPVYSDKHLSHSFVEVQRIVDTVHRLGFPMMADSSLPFSWRLPELELPLGCEIEDALMARPPPTPRAPRTARRAQRRRVRRSAAAGWTRTASTRWHRCRAWLSAAPGARPALPRCGHCAAPTSGRRARPASSTRRCSRCKAARASQSSGGGRR
jgi:hypothetical protein